MDLEKAFDRAPREVLYIANVKKQHNAILVQTLVDYSFKK